MTLTSLFDVAKIGFAAAVFVVALIGSLVVGSLMILFSIHLITCGIKRFKDWRESRGK